MELNEVFPAIQAAEEAVRLDPTWSVARQTLGRAQLGLGEVHMVSIVAQASAHAQWWRYRYLPAIDHARCCLQALQNFQKALHLDPSNEEVCLRKKIIVNFGICC